MGRPADVVVVESRGSLYRAAARLLPAALFAAVGALNLRSAIIADSQSTLIHQLLSAALWFMFATLVLLRPVPVRRTTDRVAVAVAFAAQGAVIVLGALGEDAGGGARVTVGSVLLAGGLIFALVSVAVLGRCFGVLPDVRGLVTRGPYRFVRHPLYLGELVAALGVALGTKRFALAMAVWVVCVALQLARTRYEERSLTAEFPEYQAYSQRTKRLVPFLV
ncbi:MAG TPA: isoprenylcysteine carboxylmethyltransferase family protein [Gaiellales bacterium]|nr:isoprenylcysteine carboxylmethyltransferase family protein [Gaiellales bacterium]